MKKFLAVLLSLLLVFSLCVPTFAEDGDKDSNENTGSSLSGIEGILSDLVDKVTGLFSGEGGLDSSMIINAVKGVIDQVKDFMWQNACNLPTPEDLTPENLQQMIDNYLWTDNDGNPYTDVSGNVSINPGKVDLLFEALEILEYPEIEQVLDAMKVAGLLSEDDYNALHLEAERRAAAEAEDDRRRAEEGVDPPPNPLDGVKGFFENAFGFVSDLFSGLLGGLGCIGDLLGGLFGGGNAPEPVTPISSTDDDHSTDEDFQNNKTGDLALYSVAGVALAAGLVLVLTKKKKKK